MKKLFVRELHQGMGVAVARRTVFRPQEKWEDVAYRVAQGNTSLCRLGDIAGDRPALEAAIASGGVLMSGRHLQHGDHTQGQRNLEIYSNCSTAALSSVKFYLLLNGSGVGRAYDDSLMVVDWRLAPKLRLGLSPNHPDFPDTPAKRNRVMKEWGIASDEEMDGLLREFQENSVAVDRHVVADSREGWGQAAELYEAMTYDNTVAFEKGVRPPNTELKMDFSSVRQENAPIAGMQNRPASGPLSVMEAFFRIRSLAHCERWEQAMRVDHEFSKQVQVGGARRAARMSTKWWKDPEIFKFIRIKSDCGLWTSNNSVAVDEEFWTGVITGNDPHAVRVFEEVTRCMFVNGEPGFINVHKLESHGERIVEDVQEDFASDRYQISFAKGALEAVYRALENTKYHYITNPCVTGDTLVDTSFGMRRVDELVGSPFTAIVDGQGFPSTAAGFWSNGVKDVYRVTLSNGTSVKATWDHRFLTVGGWTPVSALDVGDPLFLSESTKKNFVSGEVLSAVVSIEHVGKEEVFDCTIPGPHCYSANGVKSHNCGEISLHILGGYCVIADIAPALLPWFSLQELAAFRKNPSTAPEGFWQTWDESFMEACRVVSRSLVRVNALPALYGREVQRTERIGVGLTGIHEYAWLRFGLCFDDLVDPDISKSLPFWEMLSKGSQQVRAAADEYCTLLERNKPHTYTTIKPAGTTSKLFGLTEGAHLPSHKFLVRWVQFDVNAPQVADLRAKGYPVRELKGFAGKAIVGFPTLPTITSLGMPYVITAPEATPEQQYEWLRRLEKYWIGETGGNQVSYTLKVYTDKCSLDEFRQTLINNQPTVRCCSVMPSKPDHELGYEYLPEEEVSAEDFIRIVEGIRDEELEQAIDMNTLLCASGACPL